MTDAELLVRILGEGDNLVDTQFPCGCALARTQSDRLEGSRLSLRCSDPNCALAIAAQCCCCESLSAQSRLSVKYAVQQGLVDESQILVDAINKPFRPPSRDRDHDRRCPKYREWRDLSSFVYFVQVGLSGPIKIGTAQNVKQRITQLQTANPNPLRLLAVVRGGPPLEIDLHERLKEHRQLREWFTPNASVLGAALLERCSDLFEFREDLTLELGGEQLESLHAALEKQS